MEIYKNAITIATRHRHIQDSSPYYCYHTSFVCPASALLPSKIVARPRTSPHNVVDDARRACSASIARKIRVVTHSNAASAIYPNHMGGDPFMLVVFRLTIHSRLYKSVFFVIGYGP